MIVRDCFVNTPHKAQKLCDGCSKNAPMRIHSTFLVRLGYLLRIKKKHNAMEVAVVHSSRPDHFLQLFLYNLHRNMRRISTDNMYFWNSIYTTCFQTVTFTILPQYSSCSCLSNGRTRTMKGFSIWFVSVSPTVLSDKSKASKSKSRSNADHMQTHS